MLRTRVCRDKSKLVATKLLFVATKMFVATSILSVFAFAVVPNTGVIEREGNIWRCQLALHVSRVKKLLRQKNLSYPIE